MSFDDAMEAGRDAFARRDWRTACAEMSRADDASPLPLEDLERLATAAYLLGDEHRSIAVMMRVHREARRRNDVTLAARAAFWVSFHLFQRGEVAQASGWLGHGQAVIDESGEPCSAQGYFLMLAGLQHLEGGDPAAAFETFTKVHEHGRSFTDPDLCAFGRLGQGQSSIMLGHVRRGISYLDEVMAAVTAEEVSPVVSGIAYCAVIETCNGMFDVARAREWTAALSRWCSSQPDLVPYRGQCLVHRAQILQLNGEWTDAMAEAERAGRLLGVPPGNPAQGAALYEQAELHRLRGELAEAEECYRLAGEQGKGIQPGLGLLRLAQGRVEVGLAGVRQALDQATSLLSRPRLLAAHVELALAAHEVEIAREAADELDAIAREVGAPYLEAIAAQARSAVRLSERQGAAAVAAGRQAWTIWQRLEAPYEAARSRALVGQASRMLGDEDAAQVELAAARKALEGLQAVTELRRLEAAGTPATPEGPRQLSPREREVLRLIAGGKSNRTIAAELVLSEKTVARHTANIFAKLDLSSRSAATAYAFRHGLV